MKAFSASVVLLLALPLCAQAPKNSQAPIRSSDERIAVIEAKLAILDKLNDRLDKFQDKINDLSNQLASLNTKMSVVIWIGTVVDGLLIAQLFAGFQKDRKASTGLDYGDMFRKYGLGPVDVEAAFIRFLMTQVAEEHRKMRPEPPVPNP